MTDDNYTADEQQEERLIGKRAECAFCRNKSDYVLDVSDSAPEEIRVVNGIALPVCVKHLSDMKEANLNG